jgi:hypothetical protein
MAPYGVPNGGSDHHESPFGRLANAALVPHEQEIDITPSWADVLTAEKGGDRELTIKIIGGLPE